MTLLIISLFVIVGLIALSLYDIYTTDHNILNDIDNPVQIINGSSKLSDY